MTHQIDYQGSPEATSDKMAQLGIIAEVVPESYDTLLPEFQRKADVWFAEMCETLEGDFVSVEDVGVFQAIVSHLHHEQARLDFRRTETARQLAEADTDLDWVKPPEDEDRLVAQDNARRKERGIALQSLIVMAFLALVALVAGSLLIPRWDNPFAPSDRGCPEGQFWDEAKFHQWHYYYVWAGIHDQPVPHRAGCSGTPYAPGAEPLRQGVAPDRFNDEGNMFADWASGNKTALDNAHYADVLVCVRFRENPPSWMSAEQVAEREAECDVIQGYVSEDDTDENNG